MESIIKADMQKCKVYALSSSENGRIRYIGQTIQSLSRRLAQHIADAKRFAESKSYLHRWIRKTLRNGYNLQINLIDSDCVVDLSEAQWIACFRKTTPDLVNTEDGGKTGKLGHKLSDETKAKMRGPKSVTHRVNISKGLRGTHSEKRSLSQVGNSKSKGESNRHAVLTENQVIEIKRELKSGCVGSELARKYGVQKSAISKINVGRSWKHIRI